MESNLMGVFPRPPRDWSGRGDFVDVRLYFAEPRCQDTSLGQSQVGFNIISKPSSIGPCLLASGNKYGEIERLIIMCSAFRQQWFAHVALSASETAHETKVGEHHTY